MATGYSRENSRTSRGRWDAEDFGDLEDDLTIDFETDPGLDEFGERIDDAGFDRRPRRPAKSPARGGGKRSDRDRRKARPAEPDDEYAEEDDVDPEISELLARKERERRKATISEPFKCRHCRAFIGMPPTGGSQRNHCPMCLYSLHVDLKTPGDRASDCRSLMEPIGTFYRPNLEQVVVHRCLGCGFERYNRIAADDNPVLLSTLPTVEPPAQTSWEDET